MMYKLGLGVTGHRKLLYIDILDNLINDTLKLLALEYTFTSIVSPLADGSDRVIADILLQNYHSKLITPLPFSKEEYEKDFPVESRKEFKNFLTIAYKISEVCSLKDNRREECYFKVGKEVVDKCDVLIAVWDGGTSKGLGGTADIVAYAKKIKKHILHINTQAFKVCKINFENLDSVLNNPNNPKPQ